MKCPSGNPGPLQEIEGETLGTRLGLGFLFLSVFASLRGRGVGGALVSDGTLRDCY